ncbi:hypothetical protein [Streptomyces chartreusis]|uniref:hypothetical protein n=1 Tax=Streptomyces chartreusis TaxID=1969 RepID=UPI003813A358
MSAPTDVTARLVPVSPDLVERLERDGVWEGVLSFPDAIDDPDQLSLTLHPTGIYFDGVHAVVPVADGPGERWIVACEDGLFGLDSETGARIRIGPLPVGLFSESADTDLVVVTDRAGRFVAVAPAGGRQGVVIETSTGTVTMRLDRGDYHANICRFPLAFAHVGDQTVLVHASEWNRLDCSDPATGTCLTERATPQCRGTSDVDVHYLDYFFSSLSVSPGSRRIVSDGWIWHPWGVLAIWDLEGWLGYNAWESEDGPSRFTPAPRPEAWDAPLTWLNDDHLAVWGFGVAERLHHGIRIYDVVHQEEIDWFPGPMGRFVSDGTLLYTLEPELSVYDIATGHRLLSGSGFAAHARHPRTGRFLGIKSDGALEVAKISKVE